MIIALIIEKINVFGVKMESAFGLTISVKKIYIVNLLNHLILLIPVDFSIMNALLRLMEVDVLKLLILVKTQLLRIVQIHKLVFVIKNNWKISVYLYGNNHYNRVIATQ